MHADFHRTLNRTSSQAGNLAPSTAFSSAASDNNNYSVFKEAAAAAGATSAFPTPSRKRRTVFLLYMHEKKTVSKGRSVQHSTGRLSLRLASYLLLFVYFFTVSIDFKISREKQQLQ